MIPGIGLGNLMDVLKHAGKLRGELEQMKNLVVEGSAGGGMVLVRISARLEMLSCKIDPQVFAERDGEMLEDLVIAATNQALDKVRQAFAEKMGGFNLPGLTDLLAAPGDSKPNS